MSDEKKDMYALMRLISFAKSEAQRLNLSEVEMLLDLPGLSLCLSYSDIDLEEYRDTPNSNVARKISK